MCGYKYLGVHMSVSDIVCIFSQIFPSTCLSLLSSAISRGTDSWQELTLGQNGDSWVTALLCCRILSTSLSGDTRGTRSCVCVLDDGLVKPGEMSVFPTKTRQRWRGGTRAVHEHMWTAALNFSTHYQAEANVRTQLFNAIGCKTAVACQLPDTESVCFLIAPMW